MEQIIDQSNTKKIINNRKNEQVQMPLDTFMKLFHHLNFQGNCNFDDLVWNLKDLNSHGNICFSHLSTATYLLEKNESTVLTSLSEFYISQIGDKLTNYLTEFQPDQNSQLRVLTPNYQADDVSFIIFMLDYQSKNQQLKKFYANFNYSLTMFRSQLIDNLHQQTVNLPVISLFKEIGISLREVKDLTFVFDDQQQMIICHLKY